MSRKSIGAFIAILRKAKGLTQRELADQLNVSDKTVSRWERDETAPDLSLLPILADLFEVSCDELLRGERISDDKRAADPERIQARSEEQLQRLTKRSRTSYCVQSALALGLAALGLIAAMAINFAAHRADLAFLTALAFLVGAAVLQAIGTARALAANAADTESAAVTAFRDGVIIQAYKAFAAMLAVLAFTLPLLALPLGGTFGLDAPSWFSMGLLLAAIVVLLCYALQRPALRWLKRQGLLVQLPEAPGLGRRARLLFLLASVLVFATTMSLHGVVRGRVERMEDRGNSFFDVQAFQDYMEAGDPDTMPPEEEVPEFTETIFLADGTKTQLRFRQRNSAVDTYVISPAGLQEGKPFAVVYSAEDMQQSWAARVALDQQLRLLLAAELMLGLLLWHQLKKRFPA